MPVVRTLIVYTPTTLKGIAVCARMDLKETPTLKDAKISMSVKMQGHIHVKANARTHPEVIHVVAPFGCAGMAKKDVTDLDSRHCPQVP
uniref:Uncharacterized protein n=1 Tax=Rhizophora mucronata TaxID=61149 RepID=A0A2P2NSH7_RHIMU